MSDRAQPGAIDSLVRNYELGDALGQFSGGWVVPADKPTASAQRSDLDETAFTAFDQTSSSSSLTVTIGPGEAFVDGWLATDTPTDVDLAASTTGQTVGVSWDPDAVYDPDTDADRDAADRVVVALEGDVSSLDPFLPLWTFDTDGSGVTSTTDGRTLGPSVDPKYLAGADIPTASSGEFLRKGSDGLEFAEIIGGATVQKNAPSSPDIGQLWYDPATAIFKVYSDNGSGATWQPVPPIQILEEASTFTEEDVNITNNSTVINSNSIALGFETQTGSTVTRPTDQYNNSDITYKSGVVLSPNTDLVGVTFTISSNTTELSNVYIHDGDSVNDPVIASKSGSYSSGTTVTLDVNLSASNNYLLVGDDDGNSYTSGSYYRTYYPYTSTDIDLTDGYDNGIDGQYGYTFNDIVALVPEPKSSGNALIEWVSGRPKDINSYDLATFKRTLDNETVTVDVEDGNGNVLFSDIGQNFDISTVDPSKNVKLRVYISRNDANNEPTLDYAARRYTY